MRTKNRLHLAWLGLPRTIDGDVRRWMRRGGLATHYRWENNTMGRAWGGSPRNIDGRIILQVGGGESAMHHRREEDATDRAGGGRRERKTQSTGARLHAPTPRD